jgi:hypothetical protein
VLYEPPAAAALAAAMQGLGVFFCEGIWFLGILLLLEKQTMWVVFGHSSQ